MVSMTLAMGSDDIPESRIIRHEVDLFGFQQLDEEYLTKVNYKGLVGLECSRTNKFIMLV